MRPTVTRIFGGDRTRLASLRSVAPRLQQLHYEEYELADIKGIRRRGEIVRVDKIQQSREEDEMKFSHSIQFNAVPDWSCYYIAYSNLKKLIHQLEKTIHKSSTDDSESSPLLPAEDPDRVFEKALDAELEKISSFYGVRELKIFHEVSDLLKDEVTFDSSFNQTDDNDVLISCPPTQNRQDECPVDSNNEEDDEVDENIAPRRRLHSESETNRSKYNTDVMSEIDEARDHKGVHVDSSSFSGQHSSQVYDEDCETETISFLNTSGTLMKRQIINVYVQLCELKSFLQLNRTGFIKVLKKYDKVLGRNLKSEFLASRLNSSGPFRPETLKRIEENIEKIERTYAKFFSSNDLAFAKRELRLNVREHIIWERNTVWRDMIRIERKTQSAHFGLRRTILAPDNDPSLTRLQGDDDYEVNVKKEVITPFGKIYFPIWLFNSTLYYLFTILLIFIVLLYIPTSLKDEQQNCLAMLLFVSLLWATEAIPLFVTSLMIPFLCVILRVLRCDQTPHHRLQPVDATKYIFAAMWTPVIMLLLGGFTIAAALSKYNIARQIATFVLCKAGNNPKIVLIVNMFVAAFASMWISNVAAPVLCFSIIQPLLRNLSPDSQMSKALILGIALASNIGGMLSPIASPQNIVAIQIMQPPPSWGVWFFITIPVGVISILFTWVILIVSFRPDKGTIIVPIRAVKDKFTSIQWFISFVTLVTIFLWCLSHQLEWLFGDMGVIAIIPLVLFFGTGILTKEDFNNFLWTIIILAAGGLSLGKAVDSSGLLHTIAHEITEKTENLSLYGILAVFATLILVIATFISHTVAALIILPLLHSVGISMDEPHPNLLVMSGALMCSAAMGLPTSGFPNMTAIMMENPQTGKRYLKASHFLSRGIPSSVISLLIVLSIGYALMYIVGL